MSRLLYYVGLLQFIAMATVAGIAQTSATPLTEAAAVQLALQKHPSLRAAQAQAGMAHAQVGIARAEQHLQVSANGMADASTMESAIAVPGVMPQAILQSQDKTSLDVNGMAMLPLYTGGRIQQNIRAAEFNAKAADSQVTAARVQLAADVRTAYAGWQQALAMVRVATDTVTAQQSTTTQVTQLYETGKVPRFDLLRAQAALAAAQQQLANAQADATTARARLAQTIGVSADTLAAPVEENALPTPPTGTIETALARRPELLAAGQTISARQANVLARQAAYKPQVYAFGMADGFVPSNMGDNVGLTVGVVAGVPILDGGRRRAEASEAQQAVTEAQAARDTLTLQIRAEVAGAEARVTAARQNIDTATAQVAAANESYAVAQARYTAGRGTIVELLDAQRAVTEAQQNLVTAHAQYQAALAELYRAIGVDTVAA